jgi:hypothetical protein
MHAPSERDWKVFREVRELALDRFYQRTLDEIAQVATNDSGDHQERYHALYRLVRDRDAELATMFDDPRRSHMLQQLAAIQSRDLLEPEELARFTAETRESLIRFARYRSPESP